MRASSAKAKGRRCSADLKATILDAFKDLEGDDIVVTPSGVNGPDLHLSPKAKALFPFDIECKNQEALNIWKSLEQAKTHGGKPLLVFTRNRTPTYAALKIEDFIEIVKNWRQEKNVNS